MSADQDSTPRIPEPPTGLRAIPWRVPIWFYRIRLGRLFGHRALMLTHTGRISGKPRQAVLEVIRYHKSIHYVASGFGEKSDWFRNIKSNPEVTIHTAGKVIPAKAKILSKDEASEVFSIYVEKHPNAIKNLAKLVGYKIGDSRNEHLEFLRQIPVIAFYPKG